MINDYSKNIWAHLKKKNNYLKIYNFSRTALKQQYVRNVLEGMLMQWLLVPISRVSGPKMGLRSCISDELPGDGDAPETTFWKSFLQWET